MEPFYITYLTYLLYLTIVGISFYGGYKGSLLFYGWFTKKKLQKKCEPPSDLLFWETGDKILIYSYKYIQDKKRYGWDLEHEGRFVRALSDTEIIIHGKNENDTIINLDNNNAYHIENLSLGERKTIQKINNNSFQEALDEARNTLLDE